MARKIDVELSNLREYRKQAIKAAHELCYGDEVKARIRDAKSQDEIASIMKTARENS